MKRTVVAAIAVFTLAASLGLASCSSSASADCLNVPSGKASESVTVTGDVGGQISTNIPKGLTTSELERTVVIDGTGDVPKAGQKFDASLSFYSGTTGQELTSTQAAFTGNDTSLPKAIRAGVECLPVGSRTIAVFPATDLYSADQLAQLGMTTKDTLVVVTDVIKIEKDPKVSEWKEGVPTVTFDASGVPTIDLSHATRPDTLAVKVLKKGTGATVTASDQVTVHYYGLNWADGQMFDGNYGASATTFGVQDVITGFRLALVGQKVGTQLLVSIPAQYAYGTGTPSANNQLAGQDLLFLMDIEGVTPAN